jgi:hypothetical protein
VKETTMEFETARTVADLKEVLDNYGDNVDVRCEDRNGKPLNVEVADTILEKGYLTIQGGLAVVD